MFQGPFPLLETGRLVLREANDSDDHSVHFLRNDSAVNRYVKRKGSNSLDEAADFIARVRNNFTDQKGIYWCITQKDDDTMIGSICFWNFSEDMRSAELGYDLHPDWQGKGIMAEALRAILWQGFLKLKLTSVSAYTQHDNVSSIQLLVRHGFQHDPKLIDEDNWKNKVFLMDRSAYFEHIQQPKSLKHFLEVANAVKALPYGRTTSRDDLSLVLTEGKGSCSSKHAFLADIAHKNGLKQVDLVLAIYLMDERNTPAIGKTLANSGIPCIPEAHCYLKIEGKRHDFTHINADITAIEPALVSELIIHPEQVNTFKIDYHKDYLKNWISEHKVDLDFESLWNLREACINKLSQEWGGND